MKKFSLYTSLSTLGILAIVIQIILIRELLVIFSGNELSIGIFFTQWLFAQAIGSYLSSKISINKVSNLSLYIYLQTLLAGVFPLLIYLARIIKSAFGIIPGEGLSLISLTLLSSILLFFPGLLGGSLFSAGCRLLTEKINHDVKQIAKVYTFEAIGSLIGGILVTYLCLKFLYPLETAFGLFILNLSIMLVLYLSFISKPAKRTVIPILYGLLITGSVLFWGTGGIESIRHESLRMQWAPYKVINYHNSIYGNTIMLSQAGQMNILLNGIPVAQIPNPDYTSIEENAHFPLLSHKNPKKVLFIGSGFNGILGEILKHNIQQLDYPESDKVLLNKIKDMFQNEFDFGLTDPRIRIFNMDGRAYLQNTEEKYDIIILNYSEPATLELNRFFTKEFFQLCENHLKQDGVFSYQIPSGAAYMNDSMIKLNNSIIRSSQTIFSESILIPDQTTLVLLSNSSLANNVSPQNWVLELEERNISTRLMSESYFRLKLDSTKINWYKNELSRWNHNFNDDLHPLAVFYSLSLWASAHEPMLFILLKYIENISFKTVLPLLFLLAFLISLLFKSGRVKKNYMVLIPVFTTGFSAISLSILLALLFQACYGYLYFWLGLLVAAFMVGLATGAHLFNLIKKQKLYTKMLFTETGLILLFGLLLSALYLDLHVHQSQLFRYIIILFSAMGGLVVGIEFPLSTQIFNENDKKLVSSAGTIYAMDLFGAFTGGMITSIIFIPVLGIPQTVLFLVILKVFSIPILVLRSLK